MGQLEAQLLWSQVGGPHGETFQKKDGHGLEVGIGEELGCWNLQLWKWQTVMLVALGHRMGESGRYGRVRQRHGGGGTAPGWLVGYSSVPVCCSGGGCLDAGGGEGF